MKISDKIVWTMIGGCFAASISLVLRYFAAEEERKQKEVELDLMQQTQMIASNVLAKNAELLRQQMNDIVKEQDKKEEFIRQVEETKMKVYKEQLNKLVTTTNKLLEGS
jgi:putative cell wall-binding protein